MKSEPVIPGHGRYRELKSFQIARLIYELTVRFCNRYVEKHNRSHERMIQAARSGVQSIAKGKQASATSKTTELELTRIARASMEALRFDYEKFLHQHNMSVWPYDDRRRKALTERQCSTVDEIALWVLQEHKRLSAMQASSAPSLPEITANAAHTLTIVTCNLLERQMAALGDHFETEGGFIEKLYGTSTTELAQNWPQ
jgi:four helix bundle suffix protein